MPPHTGSPPAAGRPPARSPPPRTYTAGGPGPEREPTAWRAAGPSSLCDRSPYSELALPTGGRAGTLLRMLGAAPGPSSAPGFGRNAGEAGWGTRGGGGGAEKLRLLRRCTPRAGPALSPRHFLTTQGAQVKFQHPGGVGGRGEPARPLRSPRPRAQQAPCRPGDQAPTGVPPLMFRATGGLNNSPFCRVGVPPGRALSAQPWGLGGGARRRVRARWGPEPEPHLSWVEPLPAWRAPAVHPEGRWGTAVPEDRNHFRI